MLLELFHVSSPAVPGLSPPRCALRLLGWLFPIKHNCVCKPWVALAMGSHCSLFMKQPSSDPSSPRKLPWRTALESNEDLGQEEGRVQRRQRTNWRKQNPWIRERVQFFGKNPAKGLEKLIPNWFPIWYWQASQIYFVGLTQQVIKLTE